jgi:SAM-dependent methyltransferase
VSYRHHWESQAENWAAWARAAGHDAYWSESGPPFFELLPPPGRATLDLGCGEGRVARDLRLCGHAVAGIDSAPTLVRLAREADPGGEYLVADAAALPFDGERFDLVVAFNSLMDIDDMPAAVREAARVLEAGGRLCACITHPIRDAGRYESRAPDAPLVIRGSYLDKRRYAVREARDGYEVEFRGWAYPLSMYTRAFEHAGLVIEAFREPPDPDRAVPNFLLIQALKPT